MRLLHLGESDEFIEQRAGDTERNGAETDAEHVEDGEAIQRPGLAPVGIRFAGEAVGLRHEQVVDLIIVAAGALEADNLPGVGDLRLRFRKQHGALLNGLSVRIEAAAAIRLVDGRVAAKPLRVAAAAGEAPVSGHPITALDGNGLGGGGRLSG